MSASKSRQPFSHKTPRTPSIRTSLNPPSCITSSNIPPSIHRSRTGSSKISSAGRIHLCTSDKRGRIRWLPRRASTFSRIRRPDRWDRRRRDSEIYDRDVQCISRKSQLMPTHNSDIHSPTPSLWLPVYDGLHDLHHSRCSINSMKPRARIHSAARW